MDLANDSSLFIIGVAQKSIAVWVGDCFKPQLIVVAVLRGVRLLHPAAGVHYVRQAAVGVVVVTPGAPSVVADSCYDISLGCQLYGSTKRVGDPNCGRRIIQPQTIAVPVADAL